jgi:hypothetical protein
VTRRIAKKIITARRYYRPRYTRAQIRAAIAKFYGRAA